MTTAGDLHFRSIRGATATVFAAALLFAVFFQGAKLPPFRGISPFGDDPYDAVGSIAVQVALLVSALTFARALRLTEVSAPAGALRLILRGNVVVLASIAAALLTDAAADALHPAPLSRWGSILFWALATTSYVTLLAAAAVARAFGSVPAAGPPPRLTTVDAIDDLWTFVRIAVQRTRRWLPANLLDSVDRFQAARLFDRAPVLDPRSHPWRFAAASGLSVGVLLLLAELHEGLPPSLSIGFLVAALFLGIETLATLAGFALLGRYLGLRP